MKKIDRKEAVFFLKTYINSDLKKKSWYKNIQKQIKAIIFYGSSAKEINRPDSDLDLLIFVPLKVELEFTKGEYFYKYRGREINIVLRSIERLRQLAKESKNKFEAEVFKGSEILWATDTEVKKLIKKICR